MAQNVFYEVITCFDMKVTPYAMPMFNRCSETESRIWNVAYLVKRCQIQYFSDSTQPDSILNLTFLMMKLN